MAGLQSMQSVAGLQNMQSMQSKELYIFRFLWYNIVIYETGAAYDQCFTPDIWIFIDYIEWSEDNEYE